MIEKLDSYLESFVKWVLIISIFSMLLLTLLNIGLRFFDLAFHWIDPLVRHLVFLAAFLGGCLATGSNLHIKIDLASRILEGKSEKMKNSIEFFIMLMTFCTCLVLTYSSYLFSISEFEYGRASFLGIHSGYLVSLAPFGFLLISIRTLFRTYLKFKEIK